MTIWSYLHRADGTVISSTHCEWSPGGKWRWIAERYAEDNDCTPDEISVKETDDGDVITAKGEVVGYVIDEMKTARAALLEAAE